MPLAINIWDAEPASQKKGLNKEDQIQRDTHTHAEGEEREERGGKQMPPHLHRKYLAVHISCLLAPAPLSG